MNSIDISMGEKRSEITFVFAICHPNSISNYPMKFMVWTALDDVIYNWSVLTDDKFKDRCLHKFWELSNVVHSLFSLSFL